MPLALPPDRADKLSLYAWLVGDWEMDVITFPEDGTTHRGEGEIHAGWVLEGRAIQDVWMIPRLENRKPGIDQLPGAGNWYGTTLRIHDPTLDAWRILWNDPATNFFTQQIGRARGEDIVQQGPDPRGGTMRWSFTESIAGRKRTGLVPLDGGAQRRTRRTGGRRSMFGHTDLGNKRYFEARARRRALCRSSSSSSMRCFFDSPCATIACACLI